MQTVYCVTTTDCHNYHREDQGIFSSFDAAMKVARDIMEHVHVPYQQEYKWDESINHASGRAQWFDKDNSCSAYHIVSIHPVTIDAPPTYWGDGDFDARAKPASCR